MGVFHVFKLYKWYRIAQRITSLFKNTLLSVPVIFAIFRYRLLEKVQQNKKPVYSEITA